MKRRVRLANLLTVQGFIATTILTVCFQVLTEPALFGVGLTLSFAILFFSQLGLYISLLGWQTLRAKSLNWLESFSGGALRALRHSYDLIGMSVSGFVATLLAQSALNSLSHTQSSDLAGALGGSLVTHAVILPLLSVALGLIHQATQTNGEINKIWGQRELAISRDLGTNQQPVEPTFRSVAQRVVDRLQATKTRNESDLNERIQQFIAQSIQPVVRDLVSTPGASTYPVLGRPQRPTMTALLAELKGLKLSQTPAWAAMPALLLLPFYLELHGWLWGTLYFALVAGVSIGLAVGLRLFSARLQSLPGWVALAVSLAYFGVAAVVALLLELTVFTQGGYTLVPQLLGLLWVQQLLADLFGAADAQMASREETAKTMRAELAWFLADINTREWFVRKLFTRNLPGLAKGELASQIFRLQEANQLTLTKEQGDALVTQLEYRIKHLLALPPHATDVRHEVDVAIEGWRAKASIRYTMDFETAARLQQDPVATLALTEVVRELVGMGVHLAKASGVDASALVFNDRELELTLNVHQDFLKPEEHFVSDMLASATRFVRECAHHFEYLPERTRAILKVRIPIRPTQR